MNRKLILIVVAALVVLIIAAFYFYNSWSNTSGDDNSESIFCGGIANIGCPTGYLCKMEDDYPDASGYCVPSKNK